MKCSYRSAWFTLLTNQWFTSFPCAEPFAGPSDAICLSGGSFAFFSFPTPHTVAPDAWQKPAWIMQTHALHYPSIKYLSPSGPQTQLWSVMAHLSGGRLPALPAVATRQGGFAAPSRCCKELLCSSAKGALWLSQGRSCTFYGRDLARGTYMSLLLYFLGRLCRQCWSPGCAVARARYKRLHKMQWQQLNTEPALVGEGHLCIQKLDQLIWESVQLNWYKPV